MTELKTEAGKALRAGLWVAQILVGLPFILFGFMKLTTPVAVLAATMPWADDYGEAFVRMMGVIDIVGGVGILLPAITRIRPSLTVWAALGCALLQVCAIIFHMSRGEGAFTPLNFVLLACSAFVFWGRRSRAPIAPRH